MVSELLIGVGLFKSMLDMTKGLKDMNDAAVRNAAVIDLQGQILAAQEQQMALVERVGNLEKEMTRFETWETEKQRYRLIQFTPGTVAYVLKRSDANGEPGHALCTNCYERGTKSILQENGKRIRVDQGFVCPSCKTTIITRGYDPPDYAD